MDIIVALGLLAISYFVIKFFENRNRDKRIFDLSLENAQLKETTRDFAIAVNQLQEEVGQEREKNKSLLSQKKSSETRLGNIGENLVPFLEGCPYDPRNLHFFGSPIDLISIDFDQGEITFIEVKTGNSKQSKRQKIIRNMIQAGRVYFAEIRVNEKGVKHKKYSNDEQEKQMNFTLEDNDGQD